MPPEAVLRFASAFDEDEMKQRLQSALFGERSDYVVERCRPTRPLLLPGEACLLRYRLRARSRSSGEILEPIVTGRVFPSRATSAAYMRDKLAPLVARMRGRAEVAAYSAPAALIEPLSLVVHVWPIDGELPTLVDATDRERMVEIFRESLPEIVVDDCRIELVSYRRRQRCVLRYTVLGDGAGDLIVYGKVSADGNETPKGLIIEELRRRLLERGVANGLAIPRSLGWHPELQLSLLEALPGEALIGRALEARLRGEPRPDAPRLEEMVATCGRVAAAVHTSGLTLGPARTLDDELAGLQREVDVVRPFARDAGDWARARLTQLAGLAARSEWLRPCLSHGDFKHEQLLFDGARSALVDFDAVCQAEPALDLGKFLAHLRVETGKSPIGDELVEQFLRAYVRAAGDGVEDEPRLRERTGLYEAVALLRLVLRSQQNLDQAGLEVTTSLLEASLAGKFEQR